MNPTPFQIKIYQLCSQIPQGKVTTYKEIARVLNTNAYRAVGQALRRNPYAPKIPCHRVVASNGSIGGFMGQTTGDKITTKIQLLRKEGVTIINNRINLQKFNHTFSSR